MRVSGATVQLDPEECPLYLTILKPCLVPTEEPVEASDGRSGGVTPLLSTSIFPSTSTAS